MAPADRPPILNPYDTFTGQDLDSFVANIRAKVTNALKPPKPPQLSAQYRPFIRPASQTPSSVAPPVQQQSSPDDSEYIADASEADEEVDDTFIEQRRVNKGKGRAPDEGPGIDGLRNHLLAPQNQLHYQESDQAEDDEDEEMDEVEQEDEFYMPPVDDDEDTDRYRQYYDPPEEEDQLIEGEEDGAGDGEGEYYLAQPDQDEEEYDSEESAGHTQQGHDYKTDSDGAIVIDDDDEEEVVAPARGSPEWANNAVDAEEEEEEDEEVEEDELGAEGYEINGPEDAIQEETVPGQLPGFDQDPELDELDEEEPVNVYVDQEARNQAVFDSADQDVLPADNANEEEEEIVPEANALDASMLSPPPQQRDPQETFPSFPQPEPYNASDAYGQAGIAQYPYDNDVVGALQALENAAAAASQSSDQFDPRFLNQLFNPTGGTVMNDFLAPSGPTYPVMPDNMTSAHNDPDASLAAFYSGADFSQSSYPELDIPDITPNDPIAFPLPEPEVINVDDSDDEEPKQDVVEDSNAAEEAGEEVDQDAAEEDIVVEDPTLDALRKLSADLAAAKANAPGAPAFPSVDREANEPVEHGIATPLVEADIDQILVEPTGPQEEEEGGVVDSEVAEIVVEQTTQTVQITEVEIIEVDDAEGDDGMEYGHPTAVEEAVSVPASHFGGDEQFDDFLSVHTVEDEEVVEDDQPMKASSPPLVPEQADDEHPVTSDEIEVISDPAVDPASSPLHALDADDDQSDPVDETSPDPILDHGSSPARDTEVLDPEAEGREEREVEVDELEEDPFTKMGNGMGGPGEVIDDESDEAQPVSSGTSDDDGAKPGAPDVEDLLQTQEPDAPKAEHDDSKVDVPEVVVQDEEGHFVEAEETLQQDDPIDLASVAETDDEMDVENIIPLNDVVDDDVPSSKPASADASPVASSSNYPASSPSKATASSAAPSTNGSPTLNREMPPPPPLVRLTSINLYHHHHGRLPPAPPQNLRPKPQREDDASSDLNDHTSRSSTPSVAASRKSASQTSVSNSPRDPNAAITRSHCVFHKISIPIPSEEDEEDEEEEESEVAEGEAGPSRPRATTPKPKTEPRVVHFIVPGCSLSNKDVMLADRIEHCGEATREENEAKIPDLDFSSPIIGQDTLTSLRKFVGHDVMDTACAWLPTPTELEAYTQLVKERRAATLATSSLHKTPSGRSLRRGSSGLKQNGSWPGKERGSGSQASRSNGQLGHNRRRSGLSQQWNSSKSEVDSDEDEEAPVPKLELEVPSDEEGSEYSGEKHDSDGASSVATTTPKQVKRSRRKEKSSEQLKPEDAASDTDEERPSKRRRQTKSQKSTTPNPSKGHLIMEVDMPPVPRSKGKKRSHNNESTQPEDEPSSKQPRKRRKRGQPKQDDDDGESDHSTATNSTIRRPGNSIMEVVLDPPSRHTRSSSRAPSPTSP